jgi:flagellar hook-associated protein 1 FlgK
VNLDEEASRLMQFQQQYQAAAKVIQVGRTIFDEVLSLGR